MTSPVLHIDIVSVHVDRDGVVMDFVYPHCQQCGWDGEMVMASKKDSALMDAGDHLRTKCLYDAEKQS